LLDPEEYWEVPYQNNAVKNFGKISSVKLRRHLLARWHRDIWVAMKEEVVEAGIEYDAYSSPPPPAEKIKGPIDKFAKEEYSFNGTNYTYYLLKFVVKSYEPFTVVENADFTRLIDFASNGNAKHVTTEYIVGKLFEKLIETKIGARKLLKDQFVSFTTDTWTSDSNEPYAALVVHWVDDDFKLQSNNR
jgi:hypothetical protein